MRVNDDKTFNYSLPWPQIVPRGIRSGYNLVWIYTLHVDKYHMDKAFASIRIMFFEFFIAFSTIGDLKFTSEFSELLM